MPYDLKKSGSGYYVETIATGRKHSLHSLSHEMAEKQKTALEIAEHDPKRAIHNMLPYKEKNKAAWRHLHSINHVKHTYGHFQGVR